MQNALDLLKTRRSVKPIEMTGPGPSPADIETLLTIASRVPDHGKLAPWRFIVFEGAHRLAIGETLAALFQSDHPDATPDQIEFERQRLARAPLVIAVVSRAAPHVKIPEWEQLLSAGALTQNILLAAAALGVGAQWNTDWIAYDPMIMKAMGLSEVEKIVGIVYFGTPAAALEDRPRPDPESIITRWRG